MNKITLIAIALSLISSNSVSDSQLADLAGGHARNMRQSDPMSGAVEYGMSAYENRAPREETNRYQEEHLKLLREQNYILQQRNNRSRY